MDAPGQYDLLTIGRSSLDLYSNNIGAPFVDITSFSAFVGGSPTNIAVAAQRLGLRTALLTAVGADLVGDFIMNFLNKEGVDTHYIPRKPSARTSAVVLGIEPPDRFPLVFYRDNAADIQIDLDDVLAAPVAASRALEFAGTNLSRDPSRSATLLAAELARAAGRLVCMDLDFRADQWTDPRAFGVAVRRALPLVDVAIGTEEEILAVNLQHAGQLQVTHSQISAPQVSGDIDAAIREVLAGGPRLLVVKRGARGCSLFRPDQPAVDIPGFPVTVINVLGAGDAFAGGLLYAYLSGEDWESAARFANACGAIVVTRQACSNAMPTLAEVSEFMSRD